jgi:hypothetical protein
MLSIREQQRLENFHRLWQEYQVFCPGVELNEQMILESLQTVNDHLQNKYGRWRADAYTWNIWLPSVYGHLILCRLFVILKGAIDKAIETADCIKNTPNIDNKAEWRRIYLEGTMGHLYGQSAYVEHRKIAPELEITGSEHQLAFTKLWISDDNTVRRIYSMITALRSQLPCEPQTDLPYLSLFEYWKDKINQNLTMIF